MLAFNLIWSLEIFRKDKMAYVFDTTSSISNSTSSQISTKFKQIEDQAKIITDQWIGSDIKSDWTPQSKKLFFEYESIEAIVLYKTTTNQTLNGHEQIAFIERQQDLVKTVLSTHPKLKIWLLELEKKSEIIEFQENKNLLFFGFYQKPYKILMLLNPNTTIGSMRKPGPFTNILINKSNQVLVTTDGFNPSQISTGILPIVYQETSSTKLIKNKKGDEFLVAYTPLQDFSQITLASIIPKSEALSVLQSITKKSLLIFVILLASAAIIGALLTDEITDSLNDILAATLKITGGVFNIKVKIKRDDEIGIIAKSINIMAVEIKRLLLETEEKVRMEQELKVAQVLQTTFFPKNEMQYPNCKISGFFEPASECSGDWWYHVQHNDKIYFFIGDATGHGVSAALLTSTAFTTLKMLFESSLPINTIVTTLNRIIYKIYQGQILMTFLLAEFDPSSRTLKYINASHDPAVVLRKSKEKLKKKDLEHLMDDLGPRLGEGENYDYKHVEVNLIPGDRVFFYTDGIFAIKNAELKNLAERQFYQFLIDSHAGSDNVSNFTSQFKNELAQFQYQASNDDITFFAIEVE